MVYMGSKTKYAIDIVKILQNIINTNNIISYYEPFVGGANIIDKIQCDNKTGSDKNKILIALYQQAQSDFSKIPANCTKEEFNRGRDIYRDRLESDIPDYILGAWAFFHSFAAKGFCGSYAEAGRGRDVYKERYNNFKKQLPFLKNINFIHSEYQDLDILDNSLVYCDPPYEGTTLYGYAWERKFNWKDYWNWVRELSKRCYVVCSEQKVPDDFKIIWNGTGFRTVSSNNQKAIEILGIYNNGLLKDFNF